MKNFGKATLLLAGMAMIAVGFGAATTSVWADATEVEIVISDFKIAPDPSSVPGGEVQFNVTNTSAAEEHEFVVVKTDVAADAFPASADDPNTVDESGVGELIGEIEDLAAGASENVTFDLSEGNYVLFCNLPGHYQLGMHVAFTVTEAPAATSEAEATAAPVAATEAPAMAPPATGSGGLLASDSASPWGLYALAIGGISLVLFGSIAIRSRRRA